MNGFERAMFELGDFLGDADATRGKVSFSLSFEDASDRVAFLNAIKLDYRSDTIYPSGVFLPRDEFEFNGIRIKVNLDRTIRSPNR